MVVRASVELKARAAAGTGGHGSPGVARAAVTWTSIRAAVGVALYGAHLVPIDAGTAGDMLIIEFVRDGVDAGVVADFAAITTGTGRTDLIGAADGVPSIAAATRRASKVGAGDTVRREVVRGLADGVMAADEAEHRRAHGHLEDVGVGEVIRRRLTTARGAVAAASDAVLALRVSTGRAEAIAVGDAAPVFGVAVARDDDAASVGDGLAVHLLVHAQDGVIVAAAAEPEEGRRVLLQAFIGEELAATLATGQDAVADVADGATWAMSMTVGEVVVAGDDADASRGRFNADASAVLERTEIAAEVHRMSGAGVADGSPVIGIALARADAAMATEGFIVSAGQGASAGAGVRELLALSVSRGLDEPGIIAIDSFVFATGAARADLVAAGDAGDAIHESYFAGDYLVPGSLYAARVVAF